MIVISWLILGHHTVKHKRRANPFDILFDLAHMHTQIILLRLFFSSYLTLGVSDCIT